MRHMRSWPWQAFGTWSSRRSSSSTFCHHNSSTLPPKWLYTVVHGCTEPQNPLPHARISHLSSHTTLARTLKIQEGIKTAPAVFAEVCRSRKPASPTNIGILGLRHLSKWILHRGLTKLLSFDGTVVRVVFLTRNGRRRHSSSVTFRATFSGPWTAGAWHRSARPARAAGARAAILSR